MPRNNQGKGRQQQRKDWEASTRRDSSRPGSKRAARQKQRRLSVRGERREQPDVGRVARAVIAMALAQAEREAQLKAEARATEAAASQEPNDAASEERP